MFLPEWTDPLYVAGHRTPVLAAGANSTRVEGDELRAADPGVVVMAC